MDESGPSFNAFKELCTMTDLALCTTKATAQATDKVDSHVPPHRFILHCHWWFAEHGGAEVIAGYAFLPAIAF